MKHQHMILTWALAMALGTTGCALQPGTVEPETTTTTTTAAVSDNDPEETTTAAETSTAEESSAPEVVEIDQVVPASTTAAEAQVHLPVEIEDLEEPVDADGNWTSYILSTDVREERMEGDNVGTYGTEFYVHDYPTILVPDDIEKQDELNTQLFIEVLNDYHNRFLLYDLDIELTCSVLHQTRFVSYQLEGTVKHVGNDSRFEDEREYRYYITIDRMTLQRLNLATVMDWSTVETAISTGDYDVVRADDSVFTTFSNELLADVYLNEPMFEDDTEHELDFYLEDGAVNVVIWVGEQHGFYAILRLHPEPLLQ